jgi:hypothetical protein
MLKINKMEFVKKPFNKLYDLIHRENIYKNFIVNEQSNTNGWLGLRTNDWLGYHPIFEQLIIMMKPNLIVEVGTWKGLSAIVMGNAIKKYNLSTTILCVDTWLGALEFWDNLNDPERYQSLNLKYGYPSVYYDFLSNVKKNNLEKIIIPFPQISTIAAQWMKLKKIFCDMVYIDASHDYASVLSDIKSFWEVLNQNGTMLGHDAQVPEVRIAASDFATSKNITIQFSHNDEFWFFRK